MRIVSGGQSGVDRAALDMAMELGMAAGGWCPAGRWAEDGPIPSRYPLDETPLGDPAQRTEWNVRDSDAMLVLVAGGLVAGGTALALEHAERLGRPVLVVDLDAADPRDAAAWLAEHHPETLSVGGPRESEVPGIYSRTVTFLRAVLG
jgi:hypothetical protein